MKRITIFEARKRFAAGKPVALCPHKMWPEGPFSPAAWVDAKEWLVKAERYRADKAMWDGTLEGTAWKLMYANWKWANSLSHETGYYPWFYVED